MSFGISNVEFIIDVLHFDFP